MGHERGRARGLGRRALAADRPRARDRRSLRLRRGPGEMGGGRGGSRARTRVAYDARDYRGAPVALVLGSEGRGLRPRVASACDELIALPVRGRIASLGVAAAGAAILYEILQNREKGVDNSP